MSGDTKERILKAALEIFSRDGYAGANLKDIAGAVGVVKSGFYRHYASKEELWNAVLDEMERYYAERFGSSDNMPVIPKNTDELKTLTLRMLDFTMHDKKIIMTRKILLTEQFRDARVRALATKHFGIGLETLFTKIFTSMMENGSIKREDPAVLAFSYTAPIMSLLHYCDREPEKEPEIIEKIQTFIKHFIEIYGIE